MAAEKYFRPINEFERKLILEALSQISTLNSIFRDKMKNRLYISLSNSRHEFPKIFLVSRAVSKIINNLRITSNILSAGLYFGFLKKGKFFLSLEGTEFLYNSSVLTDKTRIILNERGEKSVLYGNNILKGMVQELPSNLQETDFLLLCNEKKELIGIAASRCAYLTYKKLNPEDLIAINLIDKGYYLRKSQ